MKPLKTTIIGLGLTASVMGGVDASKLNETPIERIEMVANERIEARQVGNVVETTFPWKDQPGFKVEYDLGEPTIKERFDDKRKQEVITEVNDFGEGGFKVDILLNERPSTNVFCYDIEGAENYDFTYQRAITEEEKANGYSQNEAAIGSFSVYHKTLKNHRMGYENYGTGKVMTIPRPQVWSLNDPETKIWADLSYTKEHKLCVTVPQEYLDNANYPVRVDPTFGYSTLATGFNATLCTPTSDQSNLRGKGSYIGDIYDLATSGIAVAINVALDTTGTEVTDTTFRIYSENSAGIGSHNVLASASFTSLSIDTSEKYFNRSIPSTQVTAGTDYILGAVCDGEDLVTNSVVMLGDFTAGTSSEYFESATGTGSYTTRLAEEPWTAVAATSTGQYSIYVTYCVLGDPCTETFTGVGTSFWTTPSNVTQAFVQCWAGGGGGGDGTNTGGGGGGGGAYAAATTSVTSGVTYPVVVGAGGAASIAGAAGGNGGTSTFATTSVIAAPGWGGGFASAANAVGGVGGKVASSTGSTTFAGGNGGTSNNTGDTGGGGGGSAGPSGAGNTATNANTTVGSDGGRGNASTTAGGIGGNAAAGGAASSSALGGGGGGGGDNTFTGGAAGTVGGGGGGGEALGAAGAAGQCTITYTISASATSTSPSSSMIIQNGRMIMQGTSSVIMR